MKKKLLPLAAIAIIAVAAAVGVSKNANEVELSDLTLANVEALARGEYGPDFQGAKHVYKEGRDCCEKAGYEFVCSGFYPLCN